MVQFINFKSQHNLKLKKKNKFILKFVVIKKKIKQINANLK